MSFTRKQDPRCLQHGSWHSLRLSNLHIHNWLNQIRQVCCLLLRAALRKHQSPYVAELCALWGTCNASAVFPLTFKNIYSTKPMQTLFPKRSRLCIPFGVVQRPNATSSAFFTVSHQNGFSSSIQSASNLDLVCISYLCRSQFFSVLCAFFEHSEGLGSWTTE